MDESALSLDASVSDFSAPTDTSTSSGADFSSSTSPNVGQIISGAGSTAVGLAADVAAIGNIFNPKKQVAAPSLLNTQTILIIGALVLAAIYLSKK